MLYLTCTTITSVDLAHYVVSHAKDWVSVDCGTNINESVRVKVESQLSILHEFFIMHYQSTTISINLCHKNQA